MQHCCLASPVAATTLVRAPGVTGRTIPPPLLTCSYLITPRCSDVASAAAACGTAAFADVAAAGGPHLGAAVEAERRVGTAPLLGLDQLHGTVRCRG